MYSTNGLCAKILIYPKGNMLNFYGADTPIPYWSPGSLSFDNNCDVSVKDVNVWNMNINWTQYYDNNLNWGTVVGLIIILMKMLTNTVQVVIVVLKNT